MLGGKPLSLAISRDSFAPFVPAVLSIPLAFLFVGIQLFGLGNPGDPLAYVVGLVTLGLLTTLDLRRGYVRTLQAFSLTLLASAYVVEHSVIGRSLPPLSFGDWALLLVSLPLSLGVLAGGLLLSNKTKYEIIKSNIIASGALAIGLGIGIAMTVGANSPYSGVFTSLYFMGLSIPANIAQIALLHFLNKLWRARKFSLSMMPTVFFAYNTLSFAGYLASQNLNQLFTFLSSLVFLPALALAGVGSGTLAQKMSGAPSTVAPTVTITGDTQVHQDKNQTIRVSTVIGGHRKNMALIKATVNTPRGNIEPLKLSKVSKGEYKANYRPKSPGNYNVHVNVTSSSQVSSDKSFSFNVQTQAPQRSPPPPRPPPNPPTHSSPPHGGPSPSPAPPLQRLTPTTPQARPHLPTIDNWDPKAWISQEVHGYKVTEHLATGLTGYVLRASFEHGGIEVAIKIPKLRTGAGTTALDETMSEATRLLELSEQSKYVVQLRGILVDRLNVQEIVKGDTSLYLQSPPAIIMELMKGGAAKTLVEDTSYDQLYYSEKWSDIVMLVGYMIATGLQTIHKAGFVHLDVKPQNILFNLKPPLTGRDVLAQIQAGTLVPKLADLGSAVRIGGKVIQFTSEYAPYEQVVGEPASSSMDIYALGATLYNLLTKTPVNSKRLIEAMNNMTQSPGSNKGVNDLKTAWSSFTPDLTRIQKLSSAVPVLKKMLDKDPQQRPNAEAVVSSLKSLGR